MSTLKHTYLTDYHMHTTFSDGRTAMEDFIPAAEKAGLKEIGFSEHLTLAREPVDWSMQPDRIPRYIETIENLRKKYPNVIIRMGLEVDYFPEKEEEIQRIVGDLPLDYVIGSIHYIGEMSVDTSPEEYKGKDICQIYENYYKLVAGAARSQLFDFIGHIDLIDIFGLRPEPFPDEWHEWVIQALKESKTAFEINTNGKNKPLKRIYPEEGLFKKLIAAEIPVLVNSDAHHPDRLAQHFEEAYRMLFEAGVTQTISFDKRKRIVNSFSMK